MRRFRALWALLLVLALSVSLIGCGKSAAPSTRPDVSDGKLAPLLPVVQVRVGMKGTPSDSGVLIGMAKGYYQALGIEIVPVNFRSGQELVNLLAAGQLDVGLTVSDAGFFNAVLRGVQMKVVADKGYNLPGKGYYRLCIRQDLADQIKDYKDLKGRTLGVVAEASMDYVFMLRALEKGGLTDKDVNVQIIRAFPDMVAALANKAVDGALIIEPFVTQGEHKGVLIPWKEPIEYAPDEQVAVAVYGEKLIKNPELAKRFMVAYLQSIRDYNDAFMKGKGLDEIVKLLTEVSTIKDAALLKQMRPAGINPDGTVNVPGMQYDLNYYKSQNLLKGDIELKQVVDQSYAEFAVKYLGKYQ
ncbi:MAG: ABC transporter substrate-binding protein [Symbiobacteriia bacterium]